MNNSIMKFFREISAIPRCSGNEKGMSDYLLNFASQRNLPAFKEDTSGNIIIKKQASPGYENSKTVILQGHMDMVCEKNSSVEHDFCKEPLKLFERDGWLGAEGTTLGADNGVAIAYMLSILDRNDLLHPPLEILITTDEETSMKGAELLDAQNLCGSLLINLDGGGEGIFLVSSAGGRDYRHILSFESEKVIGDHTLLLQVSGLRGGHSGEDIDKGRGNSIKILGRLLYEIRKKYAFQLVSLHGGSKINAIPREAEAVLSTSYTDFLPLKALIKEFEEKINSELKGSDQVCLNLYETESAPKAIDKISSDKLIDLILSIPSGVHQRSQEIEGLVLCSQNLGKVEINNGQLIFSSSIRSAQASLKELLLHQMDVLAKIFAIDADSSSDYPQWSYRSHSPLRMLAEQLYERETGCKPQITAIHAGLECGFFSEKLQANDIDILSLGPTIKDMHSPDERLLIASFERVYDFLLKLLAELK